MATNKDEDAARLLLQLSGPSDFGWMNDEPDITDFSPGPELSVTLDLSPSLPTASSEPAIYTTCPAPSINTSPSPAVEPSMSDPTDFPRLRPFPHDHERTSMDADVQPTRKPRCLVKREATSPSTTRDAEAGPSKPKRVKVEHPIETKGIIDEHDWEEEGYKTRQGTIVRRSESSKTPSSSKASLSPMDISQWNKRLAEIELHRQAQIAPKKTKKTAPLKTTASTTTPNTTTKAVSNVEVQNTACLTPRYREAPKCCQCVARITGDSCRYRFFRFFPVDPITKRLGSPFFSSSELPNPTYTWPMEFNADPTEEGRSQRFEARRAVAEALVPFLIDEYNHASSDTFVRQAIAPDDLHQRRTCDHCLTSIFSSVWICDCCGREYCPDCYKLFPTESEPAQSESYQRLTKCFMKNSHRRSNLIRAGLWAADTILALLVEVVQFCVENALKLPPIPSPLDERLATYVSENLQHDESREMEFEARKMRSREEEVAFEATKSAGRLQVRWNREKDGQSSDPVDPAFGVESLPFCIFDASTIDDTAHSNVVAELGKNVIVVKNATKNLKLDWSAQGFVDHHGQTEAEVSDSQIDSKEKKKMTLESFFSDFGDYDGRKGRLKIKDWPQYKSFSTAAPDLYTDLMQALPLPSSTRPDGVRNLAAYKALDAAPPDLGPKLYAAHKGLESGLGTTRLHMDMIDAVNIMVHAELMPSGEEGCAAWDIFPVESSEGIRDFLSETQVLGHLEDGIHSQRFYLNTKLRQKLFEKKGIASTRIYQYVGDAVFIPAGCSHQVCNLADSIKVALDYVPPENISICQQITSEFRAMSLSHKTMPWKGDVMGLSSMMLSVWTHAGGFQRRAPLVPSLLPKASTLPQPDTDTLTSGTSDGSVDGAHASNVDSATASSDPRLILDLIESWATQASKQ